MNPLLKYACGECLEMHDDDGDALYCCPRTITEVFICGHCSEGFGTDEDAATECCADVDPDAPPIINQAELEAAGQMRLSI